MNKASNISSLSELRDRREEIKEEQQTARRGLTSTLAAAPQKAKEYVLDDLALPALGIGLAAYVGYRVLRSNKHSGAQPQEVAHTQPIEMPRQAQQPPVPQEPRQDQVSAAFTPPMAHTSREVPRTQTSREAQTREVVKSSFNFASLIAAGKLLIPAAQAIIGVIQNQQTKEQAKSQLQDAKQEIVAEVEDKD